MLSSCFLAYMISAPPPSPWVESKDFAKSLQEKAVGATLRVKNPDNNGEGTAVRIKTIGPWSYFLTAAHVVGNAKAVDLESFSADTYPKVNEELSLVDVHKRWEIIDLAVLRGSETKRGPCLNVVPESQEPAGRKDFPILTIGSLKGEGLALVLDRVIGAKRVHNIPGRPVGWYWEAEKVPTVGRSGGPLITKSGHLAGICSGTDGGRGFYVESTEIRKALSEITSLLIEQDRPTGK